MSAVADPARGTQAAIRLVIGFGDQSVLQWVSY